MGLNLVQEKVTAVLALGENDARPKRILSWMNEPYLTVRQIASHLQFAESYLLEEKTWFKLLQVLCHGVIQMLGWSWRLTTITLPSTTPMQMLSVLIIWRLSCI